MEIIISGLTILGTILWVLGFLYRDDEFPILDLIGGAIVLSTSFVAFAVLNIKAIGFLIGFLGGLFMTLAVLKMIHFWGW